MGFTPGPGDVVRCRSTSRTRPAPRTSTSASSRSPYTPERDEAVDFSDSYYDVNQALVSAEGTPIASATSDRGPGRHAKLAAPIGTTSLDVHHASDPADAGAGPYYDDLAQPSTALHERRQVDGDRGRPARPRSTWRLVQEVKDGVVVGQFAAESERSTSGSRSRPGARWSQCVNLALAEMKADGTLDASSSSGWPTRRTSTGPWTRSRARGDRRGGSPEMHQSLPGDARRRPPGSAARGSSRRCRAEGARGVTIAVVSTVVVFGLLVFGDLNSSPNWPQIKEAFFDPEEFREPSRRSLERSSATSVIFLIAEVFVLSWRCPRGDAQPAGARCSSRSASLAVVYTDLFRGVPTILVDPAAGVRGAGAADPGRAALGRSFWAIVALVLVVLGVRRRGLPGRHRVGPPAPGGRGAVAGAEPRQDAPLRRRPAGGPPRDPAAAERLHRPAEGHGARGACSGHRGAPTRRRSSRPPTSTSRRTWRSRSAVTSLITIPAGPVRRLARRERPAPATAGRGRRREAARWLRPCGSRTSTSRSAGSRCCGGSTSRSTSTRSSA